MKDEVQMIQMALNVCESVGLDDIEIHVSHSELFKDLSDVDRQSLANGDWVGFESLPSKRTGISSRRYLFV